MEEHKAGKNYLTRKLLPVELIYFEADKSRPSAMGVDKSKKDVFEREKHLKYYGSTLSNLKRRLQITLK